jgi:hypothetical protein
MIGTILVNASVDHIHQSGAMHSQERQEGVEAFLEVFLRVD